MWGLTDSRRRSRRRSNTALSPSITHQEPVNNSSILKMAAMGVLLSASVFVFAQSGPGELSLCNRMSLAELARCRHAPTVQANGRSFLHLAAGMSTRGAGSAPTEGEKTLLVGDPGVIGERRNERIVSHVAPDRLHDVVGQLNGPIVSARYCRPVSITMLRIASFEAAVAAHEKPGCCHSPRSICRSHTSGQRRVERFPGIRPVWIGHAACQLQKPLGARLFAPHFRNDPARALESEWMGAPECSVDTGRLADDNAVFME